MRFLSAKFTPYALAFCAGLLLPLGFAPFHWPALLFVGLAVLYWQIQANGHKAFYIGFFFGIAYFGLGVSWVWNSIHDYGHLNGLLSTLVTIGFIGFLSLFTGLFACSFRLFSKHYIGLFAALRFAGLWTLFEMARAQFMGGFPWLLTGIAQIDTPLAHLIPVIGIYGAGFLAAFCAALLSQIFLCRGFARLKAQILIVIVIISPLLLASVDWIHLEKTPLSVTVIQSNLSMRDKWDSDLFWAILNNYQKKITESLGSQLIVLPESAIPLPKAYLENYLISLAEQAKKSGSALILGIPVEKQNESGSQFYNSLHVFGAGSGHYFKRHLVPFGEYTPRLFALPAEWLHLPSPNLQPGASAQTPVKAHERPFASLICYELAYGNLLRQQLPLGQWIVSISDDGWFGRSLAPFQQQQMAQIQSLQTGRYQIMANNDGLSAVIDNKGNIIDSLPAFSEGILHSKIYPAQGFTPWIYWGDWPILVFLTLLMLLDFIRQALQISRKKRQGSTISDYPS